MSKINLQTLGFTDKFAAEATLYSNLFAGRVTAQYKEFYRVMTEAGELLAEVSGKLRFNAAALSAFPAVGDFVMLDRTDNTEGQAIIHHVLGRKSAFIRKAAGTANVEQVVASNIDTVFICMSLNSDFNLRRLERYLAIAWSSGALPIVTLTKADLCDDVAAKTAAAESVAIGAEILVTSSLAEDGHSQILPYLRSGSTAAFIGSSGVGKSTLINRLAGTDFATSGLRNDDKGRHTTTRRELIVLEHGGLVIDTPGMRELGLETADLSKSFADIDELAQQCRFRDCSHTHEAGCAVQKSITDGILAADRLSSYQKLQKEASYEGLDYKQIEEAKLNSMFKDIGGMKNARRFLHAKDKRRR
ncbi:ribosome small subunit-dependent GTPase A [Phascolarctobacterium faecium]|uniref:ribosome small subunit-dependent GTPase A n=1 Tax=Phascolarctobacterium faecium TaxID=33025 RepID=UPI003FF01098